MAAVEGGTVLGSLDHVRKGTESLEDFQKERNHQAPALRVKLSRRLDRAQHRAREPDKELRRAGTVLEWAKPPPLGPASCVGA